jgi:hypothetical protein
MSLENDLEKLYISGYDLLDIEDSEKFLKVLSIDVGVQHLGLSLALVNKENNTLIKIIDTNLIDITKFTHNVCSRKDCPLYHTKTFYDWLSHVFVEHPCFEEADAILIERQPPGGFIVVEQIIFGRFREKTWLINPRSVHKFLGIGHFDYEGRKRMSEKAGNLVLSETLKKECEGYDRQHDISDSICQLLYWCNKQNYEYRLKEQKKLSQMKNVDIYAYMDSFQYIPQPGAKLRIL